MFVKICGITSVQDGLAAEAAGADAVGLMFVPESKRFVSLERAREVSIALGPFIARVGVFRHASLEQILATIDAAGLTAVQLHEDSDGLAREVARARPVIRARTVVAGVALELPAFESGSDTVMLDGPDPGSGRAFDWSGVDRRPLEGRRWILAGGLTPENVSDAVQVLRPWGVDVSSGVESAPGVKDANRVRGFVLAANQAFQKLSTG